MRRWLWLTVLIGFLSFPPPVFAQYFDGGVLQRGLIALDTKGDYVLVPPVADKRVRVYQWFLACNETATLTLLSSDRTVLQPTFELGAHGIWQFAISHDIPWYMTELGQGLLLNLSLNDKHCSGLYFYTQGP